MQKNHKERGVLSGGGKTRREASEERGFLTLAVPQSKTPRKPGTRQWYQYCTPAAKGRRKLTNKTRSGSPGGKVDNKEFPRVSKELQ